MESEGIAVPGYVNRPTGHTPERRVRLAGTAREGGRRASMRIAFVALRAYEQRAERRTRMRAWLISHTAASPGGTVTQRR